MFRMDLGSGESGGYVVALCGELDLMDAADVTAALVALAADGPRIILSGLEYIGASGVAALSRGRRRARDAGGDLLLAAPQRRVRRVLAITWTLTAPISMPPWPRQPPVRGASWEVTPPTMRQPANMRWRRISVNAPLRGGRTVASGRLSGGLRVPCRRPPAGRAIGG
jgi:anti-anti-sigma factor